MKHVLDLFSGIGGFSLGLERTGGFKTVAFCEIDPYCRKVLARHWPDVPIYSDIRALTASQVAEVDLICGGFPCQDISIAGSGAGIEGKRSGLWKELCRLICEIRPRYALVENVPALRSRGLCVVLADLAEIGYDAEWDCIPASYVGAPHPRDRIWITAYPQCQGRDKATIYQRGSFARSYRWPTKPNVPRVDDGLPIGTHQRRALGNAVVPQVVEMIGQAILEAEK